MAIRKQTADMGLEPQPGAWGLETAISALLLKSDN
jgi:hypothetical protein